MNLSEAKIQSTCVTWLWNEHPETRGCFFSITNNSEHAVRGLQRKALGLIPGVSDTLFLWKNKVYCIEFKKTDGKQSPRQIWWQGIIEKQGFDYILIRSFSEFMNFINVILKYK